MFPPDVIENVGHWLALPPQSLSRLGERGEGAALGVGTLLGARAWDRQHRFRVVLGPMPMADYLRFLPEGASLPRLIDWFATMCAIRSNGTSTCSCAARKYRASRSVAASGSVTPRGCCRASPRATPDSLSSNPSVHMAVRHPRIKKWPT